MKILQASLKNLGTKIYNLKFSSCDTNSHTKPAASRGLALSQQNQV